MNILFQMSGAFASIHTKLTAEKLSFIPALQPYVENNILIAAYTSPDKMFSARIESCD